MAKIVRKTLLQFGSTVNPASEVGQYGSYASPIYSSDPATIQGGTAWPRGWFAETINTNRPFIQDMNAVDFVFGYMLSYIFQMGISEWDAGTTYYTNSICQIAGQIYISLQDSNTNNNPGTAPTFWQSGLPGSEISGVVKVFAGSVAPAGYLLCQGQAVSRSVYAALFSVCGSTYGAGDGSTTFNVPDLRTRIPVGYSSGDPNFGIQGQTGGEETHTLTVAEMPAHNHGGTFNSHAPSNVGSNGNGQFGNTDNTGGGLPHNNLQPYVTMSYIIKT